MREEKMESERKFWAEKVNMLNWHPPLTESEETRMFLEAQLVLNDFKKSVQVRK
jgi:hypothetical protein